MILEEYAQHLGGLLANFQSLEFVLRAFLQGLPAARPFGFPHGTDLYSLPVGSDAPENEFTSYDTLGQLIFSYNKEMQSRGRALVDASLVDVRDALAHGRISAAAPGDTLRLLKFSRAQHGRVRVTFNETMSAAWFHAQKQRVLIAMQAVHANLNP